MYFYQTEFLINFHKTVLIFYSEYKDGMTKSTMQSESSENLNANIRLQMLNKAMLESPFRSSYVVPLDLHVWPLQTMNCYNSEQPVLFVRMIYEQIRILSSGMKISQNWLLTIP